MTTDEALTIMYLSLTFIDSSEEVGQKKQEQEKEKIQHKLTLLGF